LWGNINGTSYSKTMILDIYLLLTRIISQTISSKTLWTLYVAYNTTPDVVRNARGYFESALKGAERNDSKAANTYDLAMLDIIENHQSSAKENFKRAEALYPSRFSVDNLTLDDEVIAGGEFQCMLSRQSELANINFIDQYKTVGKPN